MEHVHYRTLFFALKFKQKTGGFKQYDQSRIQGWHSAIIFPAFNVQCDMQTVHEYLHQAL